MDASEEMSEKKRHSYSTGTMMNEAAERSEQPHHRFASSIRDRVANLDRRIQQGNADRKERNQIAKAAENRAYREGLVKGAAERGARKGYQAGLGGGGLIGGLGGVIGHAPQTVRRTRYTGKGKHRRRVTETREIGGSGILGHVAMRGSGGGADDGFSIGRPDTDAIMGSLGFGGGKRKKGKKSDPFADFGF